MKRCSKLGATSKLEAFHSLMNQYCRKMTNLRSCALLSRTLLAVMDFNENVERDYAIVVRSGQPLLHKVMRKYQPGEASLTCKKMTKTFSK